MKSKGKKIIVISLGFPVVGNIVYISYHFFCNIYSVFTYEENRKYGIISNLKYVFRWTFIGDNSSVDIEWVFIIGLFGVILGLLLAIFSVYGPQFFKNKDRDKLA